MNKKNTDGGRLTVVRAFESSMKKRGTADKYDPALGRNIISEMTVQ
jgi:hypothetical protein